MRLAARVEYQGTAYCGWQTLSHADNVQDQVQQALSVVADEPIKVTCAGRTDSGVHAVGQIIHFDVSAERSMHGWRMGTNTHLPDDICLRWLQPVKHHFDARFSALSRSYRYIILNRAARPAILANRVAWYYGRLDAKLMHHAAQVLLGEQDFSSFRAAGCQAKHPNRNLQDIKVEAEGDFIYVDVRANAFLHHMVRNIVGSLLEIGRGERPLAWLQEVLQAKDRTLAGPTAPAAGLYFYTVEYPAEFGLPVAVSPPTLSL